VEDKSSGDKVHVAAKFTKICTLGMTSRMDGRGPSVDGCARADLPLWDRLFGPYKDEDEFVPACRFPRDNERKLGEMLVFLDVYDDRA